MADPDQTRPEGETLAAAQDALRGGRFEDAHAGAQAILAQEPENAEALYLAAVACRYGAAHADRR